MKDKITLFDKATGKALTIGTEDGFNDNLVLMFPSKNGTLALVEDVEEIQKFLQDGKLVASDSEKLGGKLANQYVYTDMSNINIGSLSQDTLNNLRGYTGSKGDIGSGFSISKIFNSNAELLAGNTTEETFALVAGTLPQTDPDYGKLYLRKNNAWNYITDLSIEGAAGIQGPQGPIGYTGSQGETGYTGSTGYVGSKGDTGYVGSAGTNGTVSTAAPSGGVDGDTWFQY